MPYILALDQGTTSSRAILFDRKGRIVSTAQQEFPQLLPGPGLVEHDPEAIWSSQLQVAQQVLAQAQVNASEVSALGIANQRETTVLWERASGRPVAHAIVWQSRVSAGICEKLKAQGLSNLVREKTGLVIDAYFSATKIMHLLETIPGLRSRADRGEVLFGTVDTFLAWRLSGGRVHATDPSNASRTMLYNLQSLSWDDELLRLFNIPRAMLPEVRRSSEVLDRTDPALLGAAVPIAGLAGDQQAATFGQACFEPGSAKNTYGTGCFLLLNTGMQPVVSHNNLLTTIGWQIGSETTYCLEGSVFIAGAVVQWLRDGLKVIHQSSDVERLAAAVPDSGGVYLVPAFVGLGAPHWDAYARGALFGLTRGTTVEHVARAAVESMAYQTCELLEAMQQDAGLKLAELKVDGGASVNNALMQFQADLLDVRVRRPQVAETTALGAAYLAGLAVGYWSDRSEIVANWSLDREFIPNMPQAERTNRLAHWRRAVERCKDWAPHDPPIGGSG